MKATALEIAVLNWLAERNAMPSLSVQLRAAEIVAREFSGAGSYTTLSVPSSIPPLPREVELQGENGPIEGPEVKSLELPSPACTLLWLTERRVSLLEIAGSGVVDAHPEHFRLSSAARDA